jgi:hypothetical protein
LTARRTAVAVAAALLSLRAAPAANTSGTVAGTAAAGAVVFRSDPVPSPPARGTRGAGVLRLEIRDGIVAPRISAAPRGAVLRLTLEDREDAFIAGYFGLSERAFRKKLVEPGDSYDFALAKPGVFLLENEARPLDRSWIYVTPHLEAAVADAAGRYVLAGLSPGRHRVTAWSPELGVRDTEVDVPEGGRATVDFDFSR